MTIDGLEKKFF